MQLCIACGNEGSEHVLSTAPSARDPVPLSLRRCARCETVFLSTWHDGFDAELYDYYVGCLGKSRSELYNAITEKRYETLLATLGRLCPGRRLLDVGCGHGHWVDFTVRAGWQARGIDLSGAAVELCQTFGLPVTLTDFFSAELSPGLYDVVTMFELIEHAPAPKAFFRRAAELLAPGGLLFLSTPNFACLDRRLLGEEWTVIHQQHLSYFTPRSLRKLVADTGAFKDVRVATRNISPGALRHVVMRRLRRGHRSNGTRDDTGFVSLNANSALRERVESSRLLSSTKHAVNSLLSAFDLGADMTLCCRRV